MIIVQSASEQEMPLLQSVSSVHGRYARKMGFEYRKVKTQANKVFLFDALLHDTTIQDGEVLACIDADALIVWPWADLSKALPEISDVGVTRQTNGMSSPAVVLLKKNNAMRAFLRAVISEMGKTHAQLPRHYQAQFMGMSTSEQEWFSAMLETSRLKVRQLGREWNENKFAAGATNGRTFIYSWTGERFICKARGIEQRLPKISFLLELFERDITEQEIVSCQNVAKLEVSK